jgi:hypothetical protein
LDLFKSVSSILKISFAPILFAASQLKRAVLAVPICKPPVGEGANRNLGDKSLFLAIFFTIL